MLLARTLTEIKSTRVGFVGGETLSVAVAVADPTVGIRQRSLV
jgi:hypothetical protein